MGETALVDTRQVLQYELTFQDVIQILQLADQSTFGRLEIELDGLKLSLETRGRGAADTLLPPSVKQQSRSDRPDRDPARAVVGTQAVSVDTAGSVEPANGIAVRSVTGGIFYRASGPGEPPFTDVGQTVKAGDTLGLIELMKLFTPVTAPVAGTVSAFRAANEQTVTAGQVLAVITPASD